MGSATNLLSALRINVKALQYVPDTLSYLYLWLVAYYKLKYMKCPYKTTWSKRNEQRKLTRQSAQWGTYTPDQRYRHFLKSTKYVALTLEIAVVCYML